MAAVPRAKPELTIKVGSVTGGSAVGSPVSTPRPMPRDGAHGGAGSPGTVEGVEADANMWDAKLGFLQVAAAAPTKSHKAEAPRINEFFANAKVKTALSRLAEAETEHRKHVRPPQPTEAAADRVHARSNTYWVKRQEAKQRRLAHIRASLEEAEADAGAGAGSGAGGGTGAGASSTRGSRRRTPARPRSRARKAPRPPSRTRPRSRGTPTVPTTPRPLNRGEVDSAMQRIRTASAAGERRPMSTAEAHKKGQSVVRARWERHARSASDKHQKETIHTRFAQGVLTVHVRHATNLIIVDPERGTSDPFCTVALLDDVPVVPPLATSPTVEAEDGGSERVVFMTEVPDKEPTLLRGGHLTGGAATGKDVGTPAGGARGVTFAEDDAPSAPGALEGIVPDEREERTMVRYANLQPKWNQMFRFRCHRFTKATGLRLRVFSTSAGTDTPLGQAVVCVGGLVFDSDPATMMARGTTQVTASLGDGRGEVHFSWRYVPDGDIDAMRGAELIESIGLPPTSALLSLPADTRRMLAQAERVGLGSDISKHLPALEPVFRHVMNPAASLTAGTGSSGDSAKPRSDGGSFEGSGTDDDDDATEGGKDADSDAEVAGAAAVADRNSGISQREFVGLLVQLSDLDEPALKLLFLKMDANGDGTLTWDEYISFLLKHADNALAHRRAQGCFMVDKPGDNPTRTAEVPAGVVSMEVLPSLEGYMVVARDNTVTVWDNDFRRSMILDVSKGPPPGMHVLPFSSEPENLGVLHPAATAHNVITRQNLSRYRNKHVATASKTSSTVAAGKHQSIIPSFKSPLGFPAEEAMSALTARSAAKMMVTNSNRVDVYDPNLQEKVKRGRATSSAFQVTDIAFDYTRNVALVSCLNRTIRLFNLSRHAVSGNLSLHDIRKRVVIAEEIRSQSKEQWENILTHAADIDGAVVDDDHLSLHVDYGVGIGVDRESGLPILPSAATIGTGPGTPTCLAVVPEFGSLRTASNQGVLYAVGDNQGYLTLHHPDGLFRIGVTKAHDDVVKKLLPVPRLGLVSAAMDGSLVATDLVKCQVVRTFEGHSRGLYALDWCGAEKFMVTTGFDRRVLLWDPFTSRNIGQLGDAGETLNQAMVAVAVNDVHNQLLTATADCTVKLWDIRTMRCTQTISDSTLKWLTGATFDLRRLCMVLAGSHMRAWPLREMPGNTTTPSQQVFQAARRADFDHSRISVSRTFEEKGGRKRPPWARQLRTLPGAARPTSELGRRSPTPTGKEPAGAARKPSKAATKAKSGGPVTPGSRRSLRSVLKKKKSTNHVRIMAMAVAATRLAATQKDPVPVHDPEAVLGVLLSEPFGQIVAVCWGGHTTVWEVATGKSVTGFKVYHTDKPTEQMMSKLVSGSTFETTIGLTCAALDFRGRRLITAATNGSVRLWNFNNGDMLNALPALCAEVSCLASLRGENQLSQKYPVLGGAWGGRVALWEDEPDGGGDGQPTTDALAGMSVIDRLMLKERPTPPRRPKEPVTAATAGTYRAKKADDSADEAAGSHRFRPGNQLHWDKEVVGLAKARVKWGPVDALAHIPPPPAGTRLLLCPANSRPQGSSKDMERLRGTTPQQQAAEAVERFQQHQDELRAAAERLAAETAQAQEAKRRKRLRAGSRRHSSRRHHRSSSEDTHRHHHRHHHHHHHHHHRKRNTMQALAAHLAEPLEGSGGSPSAVLVTVPVSPRKSPRAADSRPEVEDDDFIWAPRRRGRVSSVDSRTSDEEGTPTASATGTTPRRGRGRQGTPRSPRSRSPRSRSTSPRPSVVTGSVSPRRSPSRSPRAGGGPGSARDSAGTPAALVTDSAGSSAARGDVTCVVGWAGVGPPITPNGIAIEETMLYGEEQVAPAGSMHPSMGHFAWVAAGTTDGRLVVWNPAQEKPALVADVNRSGGVTIECMVHVKSKHVLVAGTGEGQVKLLFLTIARVVSHLPTTRRRRAVTPARVEASPVTCLCSNPYNGMLFVGYGNGTAGMYRVRNISVRGLGPPAAIWQAHGRPIVSATSLRPEPGSTAAFCTASGSQIRFWSTKGRLLCSIGQRLPWPKMMGPSGSAPSSPSILGSGVGGAPRPKIRSSKLRRAHTGVFTNPRELVGTKDDPTLGLMVLKQRQEAAETERVRKDIEKRAAAAAIAAAEVYVPFESRVPVSNPTTLKAFGLRSGSDPASKLLAEGARRRKGKASLGHQVAKFFLDGRGMEQLSQRHDDIRGFEKGLDVLAGLHKQRKKRRVVIATPGAYPSIVSDSDAGAGALGGSGAMPGIKADGGGAGGVGGGVSGRGADGGRAWQRGGKQAAPKSSRMAARIAKRLDAMDARHDADIAARSMPRPPSGRRSARFSRGSGRPLSRLALSTATAASVGSRQQSVWTPGSSRSGGGGSHASGKESVFRSATPTSLG